MSAQARLLSCVAAVAVLGAGAAPSTAESYEAISRPSQDVTLSFVRPGRIEKVLVKEGDLVRPGQPLVQLDDAAERLQLAQLKAQAEDTTHVRAAEAQLAQARVDLKKAEWAFEHKAATKLEVEHAVLEVTIKQLSLELANFNHAQDKRKYAEATIHVKRMRLLSPISGRVEKILVRPGECADALEDVIRLVKIDPLWVEAPVPVAQVKALAVGDQAEVAFPGDGGGEADRTGTGTIIYIAAVADAGTRMVRLEVPNKAAPQAGEFVRVTFKPPAAGRRGTTDNKPAPSQKGSGGKE